MQDKIKRIQDLLAAARAGTRPHGMEYYTDAPELIDALRRFEIAFYVINQEHTGIMEPRSIHNAIHACDRVNAVSIVKLNEWNPTRARDALDFGAGGVMVPFIETGAQLREVLAALRFAPQGNRGYCYVNRAQAGGAGITGAEVLEFWKFANEHALVIPLIESKTAVDNLDELIEAGASCPIVAIGPLDLALSMGVVDATMTDPAAAFPATPLLHKLGVLGKIVDKLHRAGKLTMQPYVGPDPSKTYEQLAKLNDELGNDLPYSGMLDCLAVGVQDALNVNPYFKKR